MADQYQVNILFKNLVIIQEWGRRNCSIVNKPKSQQQFCKVLLFTYFSYKKVNKCHTISINDLL